MTDPANLILFMSDNHSSRALGCYGNPVVQTPNIDRMAASGVMFPNTCAASAICCPSRAAIATGRYPHQTGYWDNCLVYDGRVPSWMHRLRDQGHKVVSIGKLHFRSAEDDNGFSEEIIPMHIVDGVGGLVNLLRWNKEEPILTGQWELYAEESGVGSSQYQDYDREITRRAISWLEENGSGDGRPWVLYVSYPSVHPPFSVPERLWDLYYSQDLPLPDVHPLDHPSLSHLKATFGFHELDDEDTVRRITAGYYGLVTHLDEQIGQVMKAVEDLGLTQDTRLMYSSDHGESFGHNGLLGKFQLLESGIGVPMIMSGPGIPAGGVLEQFASSVDLFPTIVEGCGGHLEEEDADLPGLSLWDAVRGHETGRFGFAEYHASGTYRGSYMWREGHWKLIYHVDMPSQLFDLKNDPGETKDLVALGTELPKAREMEARLRQYIDPEAVDREARAAQKAKAEEFGGNEAIRRRGVFPYTPPPGVPPKIYETN